MGLTREERKRRARNQRRREAYAEKKRLGELKPRGKAKKPKDAKPRKAKVAKPLVRGRQKDPKRAVNSEQIAIAEERIRKILAVTERRLREAGITTVWGEYFVNRDGTIDGQIVVGLVRGMRSTDAIIAIEEAMPRESPLDFIASGAFFVPKDKDEYQRYRGMSMEHTHYQEMNRRNKAKNFVAARSITENIEKRRSRKAREVFTRIHWSPRGERPRRK